MEKKKSTPARKPAAKKPAAKPAAKKKASVDTIEQKYQALIDEIAEFEVERRAQKKHANFFTRHRRQVETMARSFSKFARR